MSKHKIFTQADWDAADGVERMHMHLMEPHRWELTFAEEEKLEALRIVWSIICKHATPRKRVQMISQHIDVTERTVFRWINDAQRLFGDIISVNIDVEMNLAYSRLLRLYEKAAKAGDLETARRCQDNAMAVLEKIEARAPKASKTYPTITFTNDPVALRARNEGEYTDFEDEKSVLELEAIGVPASDQAL